MKKQKIIWTVLPNGYSQNDPSKLRLSVFVSPRLSSNTASPKLNEFSDFLDWPATLAPLSFSVQFGAGPPVAATRVGPPVESALWTAMFKPTAKVDPYEFDPQDGKYIVTYPFTKVHDWIKTQYQDVVAASPTEHPKSEVLAGKLEPIMFYEAPNKIGDVPTIKAMRLVERGAVETVNVKMAQVRMSRQHQNTIDWGSSDTRTRLQTARIHPQLNNVVMSGVPTALYATAALDMQHLTQDPTVVFKQDALNALNNIYSELGSNKAVSSSGAVKPTKDFLQVTMFHRPKSPSIVAIALPTIDFHEAVASLGNYPEIMKRTGLVIELEVPANAVGGDTVRLVSSLPNDSVRENVLPKTKFDHNGGAKMFRAKPKGGTEITNGLLDVSGPKYRLVNLDVDGSAMKMMSLANTLRHYTPPKIREQRLAGNDPVASAASMLPIQSITSAAVVEEAALPALRTSAITLVKNNMALSLVARFAYATTLNARASVTDDDNMILYADDLVAGYRVDVWDSDSGEWRSLCKRKGSYTFSEIAETRNYDDEGFIELGVAASADDSLEELRNTYYMPEVLTSWDGWSKVAPPPGKTIIQGNDPNNSNPAEDDTWIESPNSPATDYGLDANFKAQPGTLPRLRYGTNYRLRLRTVDLAGNGLTLDSAPNDFTGASKPITYTRFEPVPSPYFIPKTGIKSGESVEHIVVRSNFNKTAEEYAGIFPIPLHAAYPADRHVIPSRQSQRMAEAYGRFDDPVTGKPNPSAYTTIVNNDNFYTPFDSAKSSEAVRPEAKIDVPWLPDIGRGATFRGLPGTAGNAITKVEFGPFSNWPDIDPFILRLIEGEGAPEGPTNEGGVNVVTVKLPKAEFKKTLYSSYLDSSDLPKMAVWEWLQEAGAPSQQKALDGLNWALTPFRGLTFIHVTQQPLEAPAIAKLTPEKKLGDTFVMLSGKIDVHGKSTVELNLNAEWTDPIDNLALPGPKDVTKKNVAFEENIGYSETSLQFPPPPENESDGFVMNKMKHKGALGVIGAAKSTTTYLAEKSPVVAKQMTARSGVMKGGAVKAKASGGKVYTDNLAGNIQFGPPQAPPDYRRRHDFADTKYHRVQYWPVGTSRFREYFLDVVPLATPPAEGEDPRDAEQDTTRGLLTRTGEVMELDILNSARPEAPKVLYVIPTFAWDKQEDGSEIVSKRISGLRIWMERPWYSSGAGEMLGVVVWPSAGSPKKAAGSSSGKPSGGAKGYASKTDIKSKPNAGGISMSGIKEITAKADIPDKLLPYVTQWGADPIWLAGRLKSLPKLADFLNPDATDNGLSMAEYPSKKNNEHVSVAAYDVGYDQERRLWYCDIEVNPHEAYFPFIRLALARYQPKSVLDAHLSRIVMADFIQVTPDRSATLTFDNTDANKVRVSVTGVAYRASAAGQFPSEVEVTVETATGPEGDLEWIPADDFDTVALDRLGGLGQKLWDGLWTGEVLLPFERGSRPMRLVLREYEVLLGDGTKLPDGFDIDGATMDEIRTAPEPELRRRLVYADAIEI